MRLLAFCVMPNHWHLAHGTVGTGPLYQGRFKSFPIQEDEHFELVAPSQPERSRDTCRLASPPRPELAGVCHSSRDGGGMEGIAAERPGWHSLRRNGLAAGHGEASGIGIHVTSPWPPKTPPSRPVNGRTTRQIDTNETRPRFLAASGEPSGLAARSWSIQSAIASSTRRSSPCRPASCLAAFAAADASVATAAVSAPCQGRSEKYPAADDAGQANAGISSPQTRSTGPRARTTIAHKQHKPAARTRLGMAILQVGRQRHGARLWKNGTGSERKRRKPWKISGLEGACPNFFTASARRCAWAGKSS
jgi:hypothetical protein